MYLWRAVTEGECLICLCNRARTRGRTAPDARSYSKYRMVPSKFVTDRLPSYVRRAELR